MNKEQLKRYNTGKIFWCVKCVVPSNYAQGIEFDDSGVCSGCRVAKEHYEEIDWVEWKNKFLNLIKPYVGKGNNYDCIIPVSGGKDSYYQTHIVTKELGLKPLLVTFHGDNYLPEAQMNLDRMKHLFNVDHHIFHVGKEALLKLHRAGFEMTGDMTWYMHSGIFTYPVRVAVMMKVPLLFWGEPPGVNRNGMYSHYDFIEMTRKFRTEHAQRGFDWTDFVGKYNIKENDMLWAKYPSDEELDTVGVRGIYLGNYFRWEQHEITKKMTELYGWQPKKTPYQRTYRIFGGIDDMHEIGVHDWLKFMKFGYGRCTDDASLDVRSGVLSRKEAIGLVKKHDPVYPSEDLGRWLDLTGYTKEEFDQICDKWRNKKIWNKGSKGDWYKDNIWDFPENSL
ncbi:MAG: N-acetyl sugar amidotransferase [Candidatus Omnitrophica bacterium]|nr:N-acetyl sugar amidotransferase [Candidatus Omnitrophota bacterium]